MIAEGRQKSTRDAYRSAAFVYRTTDRTWTFTLSEPST